MVSGSAPPSPVSTDSSSATAQSFSTSPPFSVPKATLYERLGGQTQVERLTHEFFVEIGSEAGLAHFFVNVPVATIQLHQGKFFKVMFGVEEERPSPEELLDYMVETHVRLFRDLGLDASHFDIVGGCFVRAMQKLLVPQELIDECLSIIGPLRVAFDYGSIIAEKEKKMNPQDFKTLPKATMKTMRAQQAAVLPPGLPQPPKWLVNIIGSRDKVRAWTCELTYRFTVEDHVLADTFMALPYLEMEPYLHAFLQLAFIPNLSQLPNAQSLLRSVRFPQGLSKARTQLTKVLFDRMVGHFAATGKRLSYNDTDAAKERLRGFQSSFVGTAPSRVDGFSMPHRLRHDPNAPQAEEDENEESIESQSIRSKKSSKKRTNKSKKSSKKQQPPEAPRPKSKPSMWRRLFTGRAL